MYDKRERASITMNILEQLGVSMSRAETFIALEDDLVTQSRPLRDIVVAKRVWDAICAFPDDTPTDRKRAKEQFKTVMSDDKDFDKIDNIWDAAYQIERTAAAKNH